MFIHCTHPSLTPKKRQRIFRFPFFAYGTTDGDPSKVTGKLVAKTGGVDIASSKTIVFGVRGWALLFPSTNMQARGTYDLQLFFDTKLRVTIQHVRLPRKLDKDVGKGTISISSPAEDSTVTSHAGLLATGTVSTGGGNKLVSASLEYLDLHVTFEGQIIDDGSATGGDWIATFSCPGMTGSQPARFRVTDMTPNTDSREFTVTDPERPAGGDDS